MKNNYKEYTYNFIGGGWNTEFAANKKQAIAQAKKRWSNGGIDIDFNTFRIVSKEVMKQMLSNFD
jgi:hypothetical protein